MVLWKSPHPDLESIWTLYQYSWNQADFQTVPTDLTTWDWAFEHPLYSPVVQSLSSTKTTATGAYIDALNPASRLSFSAVKDIATDLSNVLVRSYGLKPGHTVSLFASNSIYYPVAVWAALRVGGRVNGASPAYGVEEMVHAMKTADSRLVFTLPSCLEVAMQAAEIAGLPKDSIILLEGTAEGTRNLRDLIEEGGRVKRVPSWKIPAGKTNKEICAYLNFSSGTTGLPKAVKLSYHNVIAQCHQLKQLQVVSLGERYRILAVMPLFHITGLVRFITYPIAMNGDCYIMTKFDFEDMLKAIIQHKIEELILVPPILIRMVKDPIALRYLADMRRTVKRWSSGSAPISPEVISLLQQSFPETGFRQGYGATESTACISAHPPSHYDYKYATTGGMLVANTVAKVIALDDPTKELGVNETGEICARGPQIAMGYLNNEKATAETFQNGFFHTGDVGHIDEEGLLHIEDRIKEMIKVKGQQVAPAELEDLLLGNENVEDVAVLGVPDDYSGERPKAVVVLKAYIRPSEDLARQLLDLVKEKKVRYKWLVELEFQESIPKSPTGKLLRRVLKSAEKEAGRTKGVFVRERGGSKL
jgi:4-coumarate--CoA ligase